MIMCVPASTIRGTHSLYHSLLFLSNNIRCSARALVTCI